MTDVDIFLQWGVAVIVGLTLLRRKQLTLFHPTSMYFAFHVVVFCLRPTMVHFFDFNAVFLYMRITPTPADMRLALLVSSVALIVFTLAFGLGSRGARPLKFGGVRELRKADRRAFMITVALFLPLGMWSIFGAQFSGTRVGGVMIMTGTSGYLNDLQQVFIPLCILFILVSRWRWWSYLPFLIYIYYRAQQGWGRWTMLLSFFLLVLVWLWHHKRKFPPLKFILPAPLLFLLFINLTHDRGYFRKLISGESTAIVAEEPRTWRDKWDTLDFANFDYLTFVVRAVPRRSDTYTYGTQYLQLFTEPIPRALWKNKPIGPPVQFFDLNWFGNFIGLTVSLPGDGWMSGGWIGMIVTMSIAGGALGAMYRWFSHRQEVVHKACAFLIVNAMCIQLFRDGGISIFKFLLFSLLPLFVWDRFSQGLRRAEQTRPAADDPDEADSAPEDATDEYDDESDEEEQDDDLEASGHDDEEDEGEEDRDDGDEFDDDEPDPEAEDDDDELDDRFPPGHRRPTRPDHPQ